MTETFLGKAPQYIVDFLTKQETIQSGYAKIINNLDQGIGLDAQDMVYACCTTQIDANKSKTIEIDTIACGNKGYITPFNGYPQGYALSVYDNTALTGTSLACGTQFTYTDKHSYTISEYCA